MFGFIIYLLVIGLVAGFVARAVVPGDDSMSVVATIVLGIVGSFIGGFIGYVLTHNDADDGAFQASGIIGSILRPPGWKSRNPSRPTNSRNTRSRTASWNNWYERPMSDPPGATRPAHAPSRRRRPGTRIYDDASTTSQHASATYRTVSSRTRQDE